MLLSLLPGAQLAWRAESPEGHDDNLTLDLSSVAYWYQTEPHKKFPPLPSRAARKPMPPITDADIHLWRHEWRKAHGNGAQLWGNEKKKE